ncbi:MAG: hypothetical protein M1820_007316 [Bogoriella megaspora]|nr:MAG: hypothetical protein M1820_007316 [Bogoriella megaspora]
MVRRPAPHAILPSLRYAFFKRPLAGIDNVSNRSIAQTAVRRSIIAASAPEFERIDPSILVEEEAMPGYKAEHYYPVTIGEVFDNRYQTIGKLGYGAASTVWFCRDLQEPNEYTALKVYINCSKVHRELPIYGRINSVRSEHNGRNYVRKLLETSTLRDPTRAEADFLSPRKELADRTIYCSRQMPFSSGSPSLSDMSEARFGGPRNTDLIMPDLFRAPEVVLGKQIWKLFEGTQLFPARDPDGQYSERYHLAQTMAILGPPPLEFLQRSEKSERFWDIDDISLDTLEHRLNGKEKKDFLAFMRKMLQWKPEDRGSYDDVFLDEWLLADLIEEGIVSPSEE